MITPVITLPGIVVGIFLTLFIECLAIVIIGIKKVIDDKGEKG